MNVGEILRKVADIADEIEQTAQPEQAVAATITQAEVQVDNTDGTDPNVMVSPLQQEHELLKKATGVENNVDVFAAEEGACEMAEAWQTETPGDEFQDQEDDYTKAMRHVEDDPDINDTYDGTPEDDTGDHFRKDHLKFAKQPNNTGEQVDEDEALARMRKMAGIDTGTPSRDVSENLRPLSVNPRAEAAKQFHKARQK